MTGPPPDGMCVCGRDLPAGCPSDWACSELCQSAWIHHQANPEYPHPRQIREAIEARAARARAAAQQIRDECAGPAPVIRSGTEVDTDDGPYVRVGSHWRPAGLWTPLPDGESDLVSSVAYRRWCPQCRLRRDARTVPAPGLPGSGHRWASQQQKCVACDHVWPGLPLVGIIESRGEPWPALRLRLTDGNRSATITFSERQVQRAGEMMVNRMRRNWLRLERQLGGGYADADEPSPTQLARAARRRRRVWDPDSTGQVVS